MRSSIIPNLLSVTCENQNRSQKDVKLFEIGPVFQGINPEDERLCLAAVVSSKIYMLNPHEKQRNFDAFDLKSDLENILHEFKIDFNDVELLDVEKIYYHPHIAAKIQYLDKEIGYFGAIHPKVLSSYGIEQDVFAFEIYIDALDVKTQKAAFNHNQHQLTQRDFAFIVDKDLPAGQIALSIKNLDNYISDVRIFDVYIGHGIPEGKKSVALNVIIHPDRNLVSEEIDFISQKIINLVTQNFFAQLRS
jgi:phenylalanyl-tRNA synthetase beta chain